MADQTAIARSPIEVSISPSQLNAILKSHRELHEVVIKLTEIIQDSSRSASYQSFPRHDKRDVNLQNEHPQPDDSKASHSYARPFSTRNSLRSELIKEYQEVNESRSSQSALRSSNTCLVPDYKQPSFQVRDGTFYRRNTWPNQVTFHSLGLIYSVKYLAGFLLLEDISEVYMIL